jgi:hypothetical protein
MEYELLPSARSIEGILVSYSSYYLLLPSASKQYLHCMAREQPPVSEASMQLASFNPASSQFYLVAVARISSLVSSSARNPKVVRIVDTLQLCDILQDLCPLCRCPHGGV